MIAESSLKLGWKSMISYKAICIGITGMGVSCLVLAGFMFFSGGQNQPGLVVEDSERVINDLVPGSSRVIDFQILNRTGAPLRIVGTNSPP
jgi:hypothetical protein